MREKTLTGREIALVAYSVLAIDLILSATMIPWYVRVHRSWQWPTTDAVVTRGYLVPSYWRGMKGYLPKIEYDYEVRGTRFTGHAIDFAPPRSIAQSAAERVLSETPIGSHVRVFYDAADPANCVLKPGLTSEQRAIWWLNAICIAVIALGALFLPRAIRRHNTGTTH
jgi:hypothetical protein